ncbi:uncharacterized protein LOC135399056 isoform X2 [Ornithodoros turicata]|uniref:uncharacterized protein LOC135399056 isoform X2 n=1 Tax=Ornithodoros turicata TaxID=34597 RepID=UPI003138F397
MRCCQVVFVLVVICVLLDSSSALFFGGEKPEEKKSNEVAPIAEVTTDFFEGRIAHHTDIPYIRPLRDPDNTVPVIPDAAEHRMDDSASESKAGDGHMRDKLNDTAFEARSDTSQGFSPMGDESDENCTTTEFPGQTLQIESRQLGDTGRSGPTPSYPVYPAVYVPAAYGYRPYYRPEIPEVKLFQCTFENHACGFRNQENIPNHFRRVSDSVGNRGGHYMSVDAQEFGHSVSRLITPYLPGYRGAWACLGFSFIIAGPGADRIEVLAQSNETRRLLSLSQDTYRWDDFQYHIFVPQDVRFFIEAYTTNKGRGVIAIDNFTYYFGNCRHDVQS